MIELPGSRNTRVSPGESLLKKKTHPSRAANRGFKLSFRAGSDYARVHACVRACMCVERGRRRGYMYIQCIKYMYIYDYLQCISRKFSLLFRGSNIIMYSI